MKFFHLTIILVILLFAYACSPTRTAVDVREEEEVVVPAGVDSVTAAEAEKLAEDSFVSMDEELRAERLREQALAYRAESDTLWYYLELERVDEHEVTERDNLEAVQAFNEAAEHVRDIDALQRSGDMADDQKMEEYAQLVDQAIQSFEQALMLNPFDNESRLWLGQLYGIKASRLNEQQEHKKAINTLEKLARLEKGEHVVYYSLAENYFSVENYKIAADNFDRAIQTLKDVATLSDHYQQHGSLTPRDSTNLFIYTYYKGVSYLHLYNTPRALAIFDEAMDLAQTRDHEESVQSEIDFINWDNGNIRASMEREEIINELVNQDRLEEAEQRFAELISTLRSSDARDEIVWRLGVVEYQNGKEEKAAERLLQLVQSTDTNSAGLPVDQGYLRYFNDYGLICFNIGQSYLSDRDRRNALKYFMQSSRINWQNRARAYLQIANILSNNVEESIRFAQLAEQESQSLNEQDLQALYSLLTDLHRRNGDMEEAKRYHQIWRGI
ncbi:MAG: hypothetical protein R6U28_02385 [Cyclonatronaceae bacterium]